PMVHCPGGMAEPLERPAVMRDGQVRPPVIVEVANRQAAADAPLAEVWPNNVGHFGEMSAPIAKEKLCLLLERRLINQRRIADDMPVRQDHIEIPIEVGVEQFHT